MDQYRVDQALKVVVEQTAAEKLRRRKAKIKDLRRIIGEFEHQTKLVVCDHCNHVRDAWYHCDYCELDCCELCAPCKWCEGSCPQCDTAQCHECGTRHCDACLNQCQTCQRALCRINELGRACELCDQGLCVRCSEFCDQCNSSMCRGCERARNSRCECNICTNCAALGSTCRFCGDLFCACIVRKRCADCAVEACETCMRQCNECRGFICHDHYRTVTSGRSRKVMVEIVCAVCLAAKSRP